MLPEEPAPVRGALAGIVSAFGTLTVLGILQGVVNSLENFEEYRETAQRARWIAFSVKRRICDFARDFIS
jgi:hypothetical protein